MRASFRILYGPSFRANRIEDPSAFVLDEAPREQVRHAMGFAATAALVRRHADRCVDFPDGSAARDAAIRDEVGRLIAARLPSSR